MIDVTGQPTQWARWGPQDVNGRRAWSDERGLQSLQIIAFLAAAINASGAEPGSPNPHPAGGPRTASALP